MKTQKISSSTIKIVKQEVIQKISDSQFEEYKNLGIRKLRVIGASWGVKSPTSRKKEDLLNEMNLIRKGEKEQHFSLTTLNLEKEREVNINFDINEKFSNSIDSFNDSILYDLVDNEISSLKATGFFEIGNKFDYVKNYESGKIECYAISKDFRKSFCLKEGDLLEVLYKINEHNEKYVYGINKINDNKFSENTKEEFVDFNNLECVIPTEKLNISNLDILKGSRNFIKTSSNRYEEIINTLSKINENYYNLVIAINESPEMKSVLNKNFSMCPLTKTLTENSVEITSYVLNLKRRVEQKEDTLLVVLNFNKFYELMYNKNLIKYKDNVQAKIETELFVKDFLYMGRKCNNFGSITLIVFNDTLNTEFEECFNNIIQKA